MQTIDQLKASFAIPGILSFDEHGGLIRARITTPACSGELYMQGAHITAWQPANERPVLFLSEKSAFAPGHAIRGGIPIIFPWFGARTATLDSSRTDGPSHGFARTQPWQLDFGAYADDELHLSLSLEPTELSRSLGFDNFLVACQITFGRKLRIRFSVANDGTQPMRIEEALHTYLHVGDVEQARVHGLFEAEYLDKNDGFARKTQTEPSSPSRADGSRVPQHHIAHRRRRSRAASPHHHRQGEFQHDSRLEPMGERWSRRHDRRRLAPHALHRVCERHRERNHSPAARSTCDGDIHLRRGTRLMQLILASASPRRRELLTQIGLAFEVIPAHIDETRRASEDPRAYVQRLALEKAQTIHALYPSAFVLGADTTVEIDGHALEKPTDRADAERMLRTLSGRTHHVHTGLALLSPHGRRTHLETTSVTFSSIDEAELQHYLDSGEPYDKAGAYGIQGYAARWIPRIDGDYFNVMGLPLAATVRLLHELGFAADPGAPSSPRPHRG